MPNLIHGIIQANLTFELKMRYRDTYRVLAGLSLATQPNATTTSVAIYSVFELNYESQAVEETDPPLTCIEIQSPSQSNEEMIAKTHIYFQFGVKLIVLGCIAQPAGRYGLRPARPLHFLL